MWLRDAGLAYGLDENSEKNGGLINSIYLVFSF